MATKTIAPIIIPAIAPEEGPVDPSPSTMLDSVVFPVTLEVVLVTPEVLSVDAVPLAVLVLVPTVEDPVVPAVDVVVDDRPFIVQLEKLLKYKKFLRKILATYNSLLN